MSIWQGKLSHACIVTSPNEEERRAAAREMAKATVCSISGGNSACGVCRDCRKAEAGIHPDITYVRRLLDDKGKLRRELYVEQIRELVGDAAVLPNEAPAKAYVIEEADLMNENAQNAFLKLLEEPPPFLRIILCAENPDHLLPTVRSRCTRYDLNRTKESSDPRILAEAERFLDAVSRKDPVALLRVCTDNEELDSAGTAAFLDALEVSLAARLRGKPDDISGEELERLLELLERGRAYLRVNVGVKHIFGVLAVSAVNMK